MTDVVPLKEHIEARIAALEKATEVAAHSMERRLASMNEFRDALRDQAARMMTRAETELALGAIEKDLRVLRDFQSQLMGKADKGQSNLALAIALMGILLSGLSLLVGIVLHFM